MKWAQRKSGFTIVELLIVIVVIAILAAITIVAYNGVTNRAADSAVSADMVTFAKKIEQQRVDQGLVNYPFNADINFTVNVNKAQYAITPAVVYNFLTCYSSATNPKEYMLLATSKSGKRFVITGGGGIREFTGPADWTGASANPICAATRNDLSGLSDGSTWVGNGAAYRAGDTTTGPWRAWAGGN